MGSKTTMRILLLIAAAIITFCHGQKTNYFVHNITSERWNEYICESCKYNYHPVCGNNWQTYRNLCTLKCEALKIPGLRLLYRGECRTHHHKELSLYSEGCPECRIQPMTLVCASNEITFYNVCQFECFRRKRTLENLSIAHPGPCFVDSEKHLLMDGENVSCICNRKTNQGIFLRRDIPFHVKKICGAVTMYNKCHYKCEAKKRGFTEYPGMCRDVEMYKNPRAGIDSLMHDPCECGNSNKTICAANPDEESYGVLRKSICHAECEGEEEVEMERCYPKKCHCKNEEEPTCALKLFRDVCHFECHRVTANPGLTFHGVKKCPVYEE